MKRHCAATLLCIISIILVLAGCGGSGSSSASPTISGVAADGGPIPGTVHLKDSSVPAIELSAPIAADGSFSFDTTGLTMPCLLRTSIYYSLATGAGIANINPLSDLAVRLSATAEPDILYQNPSPALLNMLKDALPGKVTELQRVLKGTLSQFGAAEVNFICDKYSANHLGLDLMFDVIEIRLYGSSNDVTVSFYDKTDETRTSSLLHTLLYDSITITPSTPPQVTGNVCVMPSAPIVAPNQTARLSGVVMGKVEQQVTWSVVGANSGTITGNGIYTAPATPGTYYINAATPSGLTVTRVIVTSPVPDAFTFADRSVRASDVTSGVLSLSAPVTVTGNNPKGWQVSVSDSSGIPSDILIDDWYYLAAVTDTSGGKPVPQTPFILPGQRLTIVQTPSAVIGATSVTTVTVGGYTTTFTTRTVE